MRVGLAFFSADGDKLAPLRLCLTASQWADRNGLCSVWIPERHFHAFGGAFPDPAVAAAAIAARTERIAIRAGSVVITLHDPVEVIERWAMVDCLSRGRVGLAFASGWRSEDFVLRPEAYADRQERMWHQIAEARRLWRGESVERRHGGGEAVRVSTYPRAVQAELPIWIATARPGRTSERAAEVRAGIFTHLVSQTGAELAALIASYRNQHPEGNVTVMLHTFVGSSDGIARDIAREPLRRYLRRWRELSTGNSPVLPPEREALMMQVSVERYFRGRSLIGSVESCCETLSNLASIGVDEVACLIDFGIDEREIEKGLHLLEDVVERVHTIE